MSKVWLQQIALSYKRVGGLLSIPPITIQDGSATGKRGAIIRFNRILDDDYTSITAGETFPDLDEQYLAYRRLSDGKLYHVQSRVQAEYLKSDTGKLKADLWLVDQKLEGAAVTAGNTLSYCRPYIPLTVPGVHLEKVTGADDLYLQIAHLSNRIFQAVDGTLPSHDAKLFVPTVLFGSPEKSGDATEITAFTGTADYAAITITDLEDYGAVDGVPQYILVAVYATTPLAVWGYVGVTTGNAAVIYQEETLATQSWNGDAADIGGSFATNCSAWYLFPVDQTENGDRVFQGDDFTITSTTKMLSIQLGIVATDSVITGATELLYSEAAKENYPISDNGGTWVGSAPTDIEVALHTLALTAETDKTIIISG